MTTIGEILIIYSDYRFVASYMRKQSLLSGLRYHDHACSRLSRSPRSLPSSTMSLARGVTSKTIPDASCRLYSTRKLKRCVSPGNDATTRSHFITLAFTPMLLGTVDFASHCVRLLHCKPSQKLDCRSILGLFVV